MKFGIYGNITKAKLPEVVLKLCSKMKKDKINYVLDSKLAKIISSKTGFKFSSTEKSEAKSLVTKCDFIISIGGDGTFLTTAKLVGNKGIPIIGVNYGKLGFLAENSADNIGSFIKDIIIGKYNIVERTVLQAKVQGVKKTIFGINEIVINQSGIVKTIQIKASYNKQLVNSYHADGLIAATPTGSTAYSLSAGGPIVHPATDVIILSPLCPHTLTARSVVLPDKGVIEVKVLSRIPFNVIADGNNYIRRAHSSVVEIKKAPYKILLAKSLSSNYFKVLNEKLLWGEDRRKNKP
ncbi:MAG TPA: NAD(+)/NADH kinase [Ignavibacteria bacterium]|nr:NAD(+)/NADH kinase [Ignavibacteria bacterium]